MKRTSVLALVIAAMAAAPIRAQSATDSAAIRATALDYIDGWWEGNAERMERAVHPDLAKRIVNTNERGRSVLQHQSAMTLVQNTRRGGGRDEIPAAQRRSDVRILDVFGSTASVRVDAGAWVDYMHLAMWNGRWVIVNVLWEMRAPAR
ncbi:MAG TPA: nuclear transport factor 2 family protein [Gemmatimonadaceae bacterium]|nr:nuclear transport factor 2 family protein [Gemmatimonadaceae bacterium]